MKSTVVLCGVFAVLAGCAEEYKSANAGDPCGGLDAVCSVAGDSVLLCDGESFARGPTCGDGCTTAFDWISVGPTNPSWSCCDNPLPEGGSVRECYGVQDQTRRESSRFDENNSYIEGT